MSSINIRFKVVYFYFYQLLTAFKNFKIMSEVPHDNVVLQGGIRFMSSSILATFCLYSLVYLLPDFSYILFKLFSLLASRLRLYSVYVLWFT